VGLYVLLTDSEGERRPEWPFGLAGDRLFPHWMQGLPVIRAAEDDELFRPVDIASWRARLPADRPNPQRFVEMFDILEAEPDAWIYYSW
jgi:hypothetical protein